MKIRGTNIGLIKTLLPIRIYMIFLPLNNYRNRKRFISKATIQKGYAYSAFKHGVIKKTKIDDSYLLWLISQGLINSFIYEYQWINVPVWKRF